MKLIDLYIIVCFFVGIMSGIMIYKNFSVSKECKNEIQILPIEKIYMHPFGTVEDPYREDLHGDIRCSCIRAVRSWGVEIPYGMNAEDIKPNIDIEIGAVAIFREKDGGHIGVVTKIGEKGFWIKESNYVECEITERFIDYTDYRLIGYYKNNG